MTLVIFLKIILYLLMGVATATAAFQIAAVDPEWKAEYEKGFSVGGRVTVFVLTVLLWWLFILILLAMLIVSRKKGG